MEKFNYVTAHRSLPSDSAAASPSNATRQFSMFIVALSVSPICSLGVITEIIVVHTWKDNNAVSDLCTSRSVQASSLGEIIGKVKV